MPQPVFPTDSITVLCDIIEKASGERPLIMWTERGPKQTRVESHSLLMLNGRPIYVQQYEGRGWEAFTPASEQNDVAATIAAILNDCGVPPKAEAA